MKSIALILLLFCINASAQSLNHEYVEGITIGMKKEMVVEAAIRHFNNYFMNDAYGIIKQMKQKKGKKLDKPENLVAFLTAEEENLRYLLTSSDDWANLNLNDNYMVDIRSVLGCEMEVPGFKKAKFYTNGYGLVTPRFREGILDGLDCYLSISSDWWTYSGFAYNNEALKQLGTVMQENLGLYTHSSQPSGLPPGICGKPVFYHTYTFSGDAVVGAKMELAYKPYGDKYKNGSVTKCGYREHHLASLYFYVWAKR